MQDSNLRLSRYERGTLPAELKDQLAEISDHPLITQGLVSSVFGTPPLQVSVTCALIRGLPSSQ